MPDTAPPPSPQTPHAADPSDLRLVLFGMPAAGKSSLLGALSRAAEAQEPLLGGKLIDETHGLEELRKQLYETNPRRTPEEVVPYPVRYEPMAADGQKERPEPLDAVLMDCDGRVANDLLVRRKDLDEDSPEGTLAHEVLDADTLILVIDASAPPAQVEADFAEFVRFVRTIERGRKERAEVAGLPVFLVLTKCDLLARPGDSPADWMDRIEQRKREVDAHFREFVARGGITLPLPPPALSPGGADGITAKPDAQSNVPRSPVVDSPFGRINLRIWATAVKRPQLAGVPARPREPYGVAELFRQCLAEAAEYRRRTRRAGVRLYLLVASLAILLVGMATFTLLLWLMSQSGRASLLASRVEDYRIYNRGGVAERLRGTPTELRQKLARLEEIRDDPQFGRLKPEQQHFVEGRIEELKGYIDYLEKVLKERSLAAEQTEEGLEQRLEHLRASLAPPRPEWEATRAAEISKNLLESGEALRRAVQRARNWYLDQSETAGKLWTFADYPIGTDAAGIDWADWTARAQKLIDPNRRPPFHENDAVGPDSTLTYAVALRFDRVVEARATWESDRAKVRRLLDVCSALGLATASKERPPLLVFARGFTLAQAKERVGELKAYYPDYQTAFVRAALPEAIVPKVRQVAGNQYQALLGPGRAEVLRQMRAAGKGAEEAAEKWEAVRKWLKSPDELASWRVLARVLQQLEEASPADPVAALAEFLGQDEFVVAPKSLVLELPEGRSLAPRESARLLVLHPASKRQPALAFEPSGEPQRDLARRVWMYTFRPSEGQRITFKPGEKIWAELKLRGGKEQLVWSEARSSMYLIERLRAAPRVQPVDARSLDEGRVVDGARLVVRPDDSVPRVPDLLPAVRGE